jgi:hypothetical protein
LKSDSTAEKEGLAGLRGCEKESPQDDEDQDNEYDSQRQKRRDNA